MTGAGGDGRRKMEDGRRERSGWMGYAERRTLNAERRGQTKVVI